MTSTGTPTRTPPPPAYRPTERRSTGRSIAVVLGIAFSLLLIAWGVLWVVSLAIRQDASASTAVDEPFSRVVITTDTGDVDVQGTDASGARVDQRMRWSLTKPTVTAEVRDDVLWISGDCGNLDFGLGCQLDLVVEVPVGTSVDAESGAGDIDLAGVEGDVSLRTGSGDLLITDVAGAVQTRTGSGDVHIDGVTSAEISAVAGSGDVTLDLRAEPDDVAIRTGSGDLDIRLPRGDAAYDIEVDTGAGDRDVDVSTDPSSSRSIAARTGTGDVTITYG